MRAEGQTVSLLYHYNMKCNKCIPKMNAHKWYFRKKTMEKTTEKKDLSIMDGL